jgi:hypothetical protein
MSWIFSKIVKGKENERGRNAGGTLANATDYKPLFRKKNRAKQMRVVKREGLHGEARALFVLTQQRMQTQKCRRKKQCKQNKNTRLQATNHTCL